MKESQDIESIMTYSAPELSTLRDVPVRDSEKPAIISLSASEKEDLYITHNFLRFCAASLGNSIAALDLGTNFVASLVIPNSPEFIVSFLAITGIAATAAPLNPNYTYDEFLFYLKDSMAVLLIVTHSLPRDSPCVKAAETLCIKIFFLPEDLLRQSTESAFPTVPGMVPTPECNALFLHTSGTTSRPKGVPLTHKNLISSIKNIACTYELSAEDACLLVMPLFHVHGLMSATLTTIATNGTVIIPPGGKFSASNFWTSIIRGSVTWYTAVPTIHQILLTRAESDYPKDNPPKLRFIRSCSASLAPCILERLEFTFSAPVLEAYAMTEASHQMTSNPLPKNGSRRPGTVGVAQNVDLCILDEKNEPVLEGTAGEVCIRGENVTKGYKNNPEANELAFASGWFHTGDQGQIDQDGYLTLTGRLKEMINRGGEKISPLEVDAVLLSHPLVIEAVSFAAPDEKYGEEVNAAVILKQDNTCSVSTDDLTKFTETRLAAFKVPKRFFICRDLPRTATGKIQRRIVSQHFIGTPTKSS